MASAIIHMAVAKQVNKVLNRSNEQELLLGSIAPDIAKQIGLKRAFSHFVTDGGDVPDMSLFLSKYKQYLNNDFELGYCIHLLTDVIWLNEFLPNYLKKGKLKAKNGEWLGFTDKEALEIIYNDYTFLNPKILDYYDMDLSLFYRKQQLPVNHIEEIPSDQLQTIIDKMGLIIKEHSDYAYIWDIDTITHFIEYASIYVLDQLKTIG